MAQRALTRCNALNATCARGAPPFPTCQSGDKALWTIKPILISVPVTTARSQKKQAAREIPKKPSGSPIILSIYESDIKHLEGLAAQKGLRIAEILHQALAIYATVTEAKARHPQTRLLLDRGDGNHFELVLPF